MENKGAIKPNFFQNLPTVVKEQRAKEKGITVDEQALYALSLHDGWLVLREYAQSLIGDLENATELAMNQGMPLEEIGRNAVVASLAKGVITRILQKVEDARETAEEQPGA